MVRYYDHTAYKDKWWYIAIKQWFCTKLWQVPPLYLSRVRKDRRNCQIFNTYFTNVTKGLQLQQVDESQSFENEESCWLIRETYGDEKFSFKSIFKNDTIESSQKITFKQSINIKWHTNFNNKEFCYLLLWKACEYF